MTARRRQMEPKSAEALQAQISQRIHEANEKKLFQKAWTVVKKLGKQTRLDVSGNLGVEWLLSQNKFSIKGMLWQEGLKFYIDIRVGEKTVFGAKGKKGDVLIESPYQVDAYIPGREWEEWLENLATPNADELKKIERKLRGNFGL